MANYGAEALVFELPSPPEQVWAALVDPSALNEWFGETDFRAGTGQPFSLRPHADGALPAGPGEVVAVDAPHRLVVRWRADGRVLGLTLLVEPRPEGSRLRVAFSNTGGVDEGQSAALRRLYGERLRTFLTGGTPTSPPTPPVAEPTPVVVAPLASLVPKAPLASPVPKELPRYPEEARAVPSTEPPPARRRTGARVAAGVGVVAVLVVVAWTVAGASFGGGTPDPVSSPTGLAGATTTRSTAVTPSTVVTPTASPTTTTTASASAGTATTLAVSSQVTNRQPNSLTVAVTITNQTADAQKWRNVGISLGSANLTLSNVDSRVNYEWAGTRACFAPGPAVTTIAAGSTITFPFTVTGSVPADVTATNLNDTACS